MQWLIVTRQWTPGQEERFVLLTIHPPIGSEMNPFSDCWLVARGFQTEPGPAGLEGGKKLKQKQQVSPSTDQRKRDKKKSETKQKLRLPGVSVSLCDIKTLELFVGES